MLKTLSEQLDSQQGIMAQVIIKVIGPPKTHVKKYVFGICFIGLKGYLDTFRKSQKVSAFTFDLFGVNARVKTNAGYNTTPPHPTRGFVSNLSKIEIRFPTLYYILKIFICISFTLKFNVVFDVYSYLKQPSKRFK